VKTQETETSCAFPLLGLGMFQSPESLCVAQGVWAFSVGGRVERRPGWMAVIREEAKRCRGLCPGLAVVWRGGSGRCLG
jgi:hypothetical protein